MLITLLMICVIMVLVGCTKFDTQDRAFKNMRIILENGDCNMHIDVTHDDVTSDDSLEFDQPKSK